MELKKYKLGDLVEVTRGMSLSGQFYSETGTFIRLTLGNFNMNGGGFKENTSKTDLYFTGGRENKSFFSVQPPKLIGSEDCFLCYRR